MITGVLNAIIYSRLVQGIAQESGALDELARPYIGGHTPAQAHALARDLQGKGLLVSFSYLPETPDGGDTLGALFALLEQLGEEAAGVELSLAPAQLGIEGSPAQAQRRLRDIVEAAQRAGAVVTLGMQGLSHYDDTLALWRSVQSEYPDLGVTLPVEIRRAQDDCARIISQPGRPRVRLCVGAYPVPRSQSLRSEHEKSLALVRCLRAAIEADARVLLATHDPRIIAIAQELLWRHPQASLEFQMYLGVRPLEQRRLTDIGLHSRVLLPFGPAGFDTLLARVTARPSTALSYLRAITDKR